VCVRVWVGVELALALGELRVARSPGVVDGGHGAGAAAWPILCANLILSTLCSHRHENLMKTCAYEHVWSGPAVGGGVRGRGAQAWCGQRLAVWAVHITDSAQAALTAKQTA